MSIRAINEKDIERLRALHEKFFKDDFTFPDYRKNFISAFIIDDDVTGEIIAGGGVRTLLESTIITNKDYSVRKRRQALMEILDISMYYTGKLGYDGLHAFVTDLNWLMQLEEIGFQKTKGKAIFFPLDV